MFYIVICEDDVIQKKLLATYLQQIFNELGMEYSLTEFSSGEELLNNYPDKIDILFLDIQMDKLTGMDAARKIREFDRNVEIVFTTAILDYIHEGYEVKAYRYLLKPLEYECILKHTKTCIEELVNKKDTIAIKDKSQTSIIQINDILHVEVLRKEITIHTKEGKQVFKTSMKSIEDSLNKKNFFRCHKSYLINLNKVKALREKDNLVIIDKYEIPVSRYKLKSLKISLAHMLGDILC
ncbi:LytR/AlgR family response regulator transcription factor [Paraclostridium bifermentans]|uniref:LytR/AlgR family response regulator transcription factor n=2 Tax=Paraclostridium bifermentans TaxID=1490 RepID=UPI001F1B1FB9|nr:LytTR family DNA-binding domain-containing protein [Paraclostridium bifermentans]MCE9676813.1 LytTR family DNA-binding domain-containing protein [Paraclostridium bifermentans]GKZ02956.1 DNA-binding response regulator [Paraclostridium bifermentans]GKZ07005.1 DNA-binding response regulator [Paraclostridium bifermentans]GKZ11877.1 DNA-binding response regulator [Paraclostridium bifermentans]